MFCKLLKSLLDISSYAFRRNSTHSANSINRIVSLTDSDCVPCQVGTQISIHLRTLLVFNGHATVLVVNSRLVAAKNLVRSQVSPCGVLCKKRDTGTGFPRALDFSPVIFIPAMLHTHSSTPTPYYLCSWYCCKMTHLETTTTAAIIIPITTITMLQQIPIYQNSYYWPHRHSHLKKHRHDSVTTIGTTITTSILSSLSSSWVMVAETKLDLTLNINLFVWVRVKLFPITGHWGPKGE